MRLPVVRGIIERRILINFRVEPQALAGVLPAPFRPRLVRGVGLAGICLIRLSQLRPRFLPARWGLASENAAHRIAVEWDDAGGIRQGVYVHRRDTSSRFNVLAGGRAFPGIHHYARFDVRETAPRYCIRVNSDDGSVCVNVECEICRDLNRGSVFSSLREASEFFEAGSLGYSPTLQPAVFDGLELKTMQWSVVPLDVTRVESSFFEDRSIFPPGTVNFDCALLMREIEHEWVQQPLLCPQCG